MFYKKKNKIKNYDSNTIYAPLDGKVLPIELVKDSVFSQKLMGDGLAIAPVNGKVYSPVSGEIIALFPTNHAIGIRSDSGMDVIVHVGINTVELKGVGFTSHVKAGDRVEVANLLITADYQRIKSQYEMTTMIVIENSDDYYLEKTQTKDVKAGDSLIVLRKE